MKYFFTIFQSLTVCVVLLLSASCAPRLAREAGPFDPARIASGVRSAPGSAAWSHDGNKLAYITEGDLRILTVDTGVREKVPLTNAAFVAWTAQNELLILRSGAEPVLSVRDDEASQIRDYRLEAEAAAVYDFDRDTVILAYLKNTPLSYGTELESRLETLDRRTGSRKTFYDFNKTYLAKKMDTDFLQAWMHAGLNPLDRSLLAMEHIRPPVVSPYTRIKRVAAGHDAIDIPVLDKKLYYSAAWSPAGDRIAVTDAGGTIEIIDSVGGTPLVRTGQLGFYPSWNPRGGLLFAGDRLIDSSGANRAVLMKPVLRSIAWWSPDGSMLAVAAEGNFWLLRNFEPRDYLRERVPAEDVKMKMKQLRSLFQEGFLTEQEFQERKDKLLEGMERNP